MSSLTRQIKVVLMSYLTRRAFHLALLAMMVPLGLMYLLERTWFFHSSQLAVISVLIATPLVLMITGGALVGLLLFFLQARDQLMGMRARFMPHSRTAHLIVIGILFAALTISISSVFWERPISEEPSKTNPHGYWNTGVSPVGATVVVFSFMILAGYSVYNPWLLPVLATMLILFVRREPHVWFTISQMTVWWPEDGNRSGAWFVVRELEISNARYLRALVFVLDLVALRVLVGLAKPRLAQRDWMTSAAAGLFNWISNLQSTRAVAAIPHMPRTSMLSRGRHRRFAVHSHKAPWVLAGALAVVLVGLIWIVGVHAPANSKVSAAVVMLTIIPGTVVAAGWRERWASLGYESLFPSPRGQFVKEIAVGLIADLLEFWVAAMAASIVVVAVFVREYLLSPYFISAMIASLMMQVLWFGAIFLSSRFRQIVPYALLLFGVGIAMLIPIFEFWQDHRLFGPAILLGIALVEMACGVVFAFTALDSWKRADLA